MSIGQSAGLRTVGTDAVLAVECRNSVLGW
jgi:hypothetical protein